MKSAQAERGLFHICDEVFSAGEILELLAPYVSPRRQRRIAEVVASRTYSVMPVLEGFHDRGNASAVLRSAEAMGLQQVHIIETARRFRKANRVTQGAEKWLDITRWSCTRACITHLKSAGYRILATCMERGRPIDDIAFDEPTVLALGNERDGVSEDMLDLADDRVYIPMDGFTGSFNVSVAAALAFYHIRQDRMTRGGGHGDLDETQRDALEASYYMRSVGNADKLLLRTRQT